MSGFKYTPSYFHAVDLYAEWPGSILCCCTCCTALVVGSAWLHALLSVAVGVVQLYTELLVLTSFTLSCFNS